jgi:hypothetical protein
MAWCRSSLFLGLAMGVCLMGHANAEDRLLGLAVADNPARAYDQGAAIVSKLGANVVVIPLTWDFVETKPGIYAPETDWLQIASLTYPAIGWKVALELNPIDTNADRRPKWLAGKAWDDPEVISAFVKMVGEVVSRSEKLDLVSITFGNEVDALLGANTAQTEAYSKLLVAGRNVAKRLRPNAPVGVKTTFGGLTGAARQQILKLNGATDVVMITYYPLDADFRARDLQSSPAKDLDSMVSAFQERTIHLSEVGYPSSEKCGYGEEGQSKFVTAFFEAWDQHKDTIRLVYWDWMTDWDEAAVQEASSYYGIDNPCFSEFIGTLGLETNTLVPKAAWAEFTKAATSRFVVE